MSKSTVDSDAPTSDEKGQQQQQLLPPMNGEFMGPDMIRGLQPLAVAKHLIYLFSQDGPRPSTPPLSNKTELLRLVTISNSNYAEKARWALDLAMADSTSPYYYMEDIHPPALHCIFSLAATENQQSRTPVVVYESNKTTTKTTPPVLDSNDIVRTFCPRLYPAAVANDIVKLEQDLGVRLGATIRSLFFWLAFGRPDTMYYPGVVRMCTGHVTPIERFLFANMLDKGVDQGIINCLQLSEASNQASKQVIQQTFDELSRHAVKQQLVENSQAYWMDTPTEKYGFTAADLVVATFVASMCGDVPALEGLATNNVLDKDLPADVRSWRQDLRSTPVAAFARRIYAQHRPVGPHGRIVIRPARRGRNPLTTYTALALSVALAAVGVALWRERR